MCTRRAEASSATMIRGQRLVYDPESPCMQTIVLGSNLYSPSTAKHAYNGCECNECLDINIKLNTISLLFFRHSCAWVSACISGISVPRWTVLEDLGLVLICALSL